MNIKPNWKSLTALSAAALVVVAIVVKLLLPAARPAPSPVTPAELSIAAQHAKLALSDGRLATFVFASTSGTLTAHAAVGLDQECNYAMLPFAAPSPSPAPGPKPPAPNPPSPLPTPNPPQPQTSNLRVLFTYDPTATAALPAAEQAILASPALRTYLEKHCPLESNCASGMCPHTCPNGMCPMTCANGMCQLTAIHSASYRFLPTDADVTQLPKVWQGIFHVASQHPASWLLVVNENGDTVIDQAWPGSVAETLSLLKKFGGE